MLERRMVDCRAARDESDAAAVSTCDPIPCTGGSMRPTRPLRLAVAALCLVPVVVAAPGLRAQDAPPSQLVVLSAHADRVGHTLILTGLDFGEATPRVTLGV